MNRKEYSDTWERKDLDSVDKVLDVLYTDHAAEMREVLIRLSWRDQDLLDKYAHYMEEK